MKVLILSRDSRGTGGVVNYTNTLIRYLSPKVNFERLIIGKKIDSINRLLDLFKPFVDAVKLWKKIRHNRYSLIHINPSLDIKSLLRDGLFLIILRVSHCKNIIVFWRGWQDTLAQRIGDNQFFRLLFKKIFGEVSIILVLSSYFRDTLAKMSFDPSKIIVTTTMFDGTIFSNQGKIKKHNCNRIIFLSRLIKEKGVYELLAAINLVCLKFPTVHLTIVGDGPQKLEMEKWVSKQKLCNNVSFTGYLRGMRKGQALLEADIFVFPTYAEGCPNVLLEAMGAGLSIITTPVGAIPEIIQHNINGILLPNPTPEKIAKSILKLVTDNDLRDKIQSNNKIKAWANYEANVVATKIEGIYRQVARIN